MTRVHLDDNRLIVNTVFTLKEVCKAVPGARWDKARRAWTYPATPFAAQGLHQQFAQATWSPEAAALLVKAERIHEAAQHKTADTLPPIPLTKTEPWLHQLRAYHYAKALPAAMLALDMGTGKSKVAIDLIANMGWRSVLIMCPKRVIQVWPYQIDLHAASPLTVVPLDEGSIRARAEWLSTCWNGGAVPVVAVVNYEAVWREPLKSYLLRMSWDAAILDESHRIKAPGGKISQFCAQLGDRVPHRLCLTGTPMPHSPLDIYAQYRFLDKGIFGTSYTMFRARYAMMGGFGNHEVLGFHESLLPELNRKMYAICYRVKAEDVQTLPETIDTVIPVRLDRKASLAYAEMEKEFVAEIGEKAATVNNVLTKLLRLQQITSGFLPLDDDTIEELDRAKVEALEDLLLGLPKDEPVVVFCRFRHDLNMVHQVAIAMKRCSLELSGRVDALKPWQQGAAPILAVQIQSGGVGIDLTRAAHAIYFSLGYSLEHYEQSRKRVHRPGQTRTVRYYHLVARGTIDRAVYAALKARKDVVEYILELKKKGQPYE
ncbi:DEAD/DEAH box helicase [Nitrospira sp. Nam74]